MGKQIETVNKINLKYSRVGIPAATIENFYHIMTVSPFYSAVHFNQLTDRAEIHAVDANGILTIRPWTDTDEARSKYFCEQNYGIYNDAKHEAALKLLFCQREYNPLIDIVDSLEWDGVSRCDSFLTRWMQADDSPYVREVSRLIFAGGIHRLYKPGCKFDDMPVLVGTKQGEGKSTIISFLALHQDYYGTAKLLDSSKEAVEAITGKWIVEVPELEAFKKSDTDSVKAFITKQIDSYRKPYARNVTDLPRRCIFIGSTNNRYFLTDETGNRRFFPVDVHSSGYDILAHEEEIRNDICLCWAEARERFKAGNMAPFPDRSLLPVYQEAQNGAMVDDAWPGIINSYLQKQPNGKLVCIQEIIDMALSPILRQQNYSKQDRNRISRILDGAEGWTFAGRPVVPVYGQQRCWKRNTDKQLSFDEELL